MLALSEQDLEALCSRLMSVVEAQPVEQLVERLGVGGQQQRGEEH